MTDLDVVVVGAGVAGCAAAIELRLAGWRVCLLRRGDSLARVESLSPAAVQHLNKFSIDVGQDAIEVVAWWGSAREMHAVYPHAQVVERSILVAALRARAVEQGAAEQEIKSDLSIERRGDRWRLEWEAQDLGRQGVTAAYLVDATGRASIVGRRMGAKRTTKDQLCSLAVDVQKPMVIGIWTESDPQGWWNLSSSEKKGTLSFYSDALGVRDAQAEIAARFEKTEHLRSVITTRQFANPAIRSCGSSILAPCAGPGWFAVGDAAWTVQPLASAGVAKALRDARIVRQLLAQESSGYDRFQKFEFDTYLQRLKQHYSIEKRWPASSFWKIPAESPGSDGVLTYL